MESTLPQHGYGAMTPDAPRPRGIGAFARWSVAAAIVLAAHGAAGWAMLNWRADAAEAAAGAVEPAILIELAPLSVAPEAPAEELPPAPEPVAPEAEPGPPPEEPPPPEPVADPPPEPEMTPPEPPLPAPVRLPEPEIDLPELPQLPDPAVVLAPPPPPPPEKPKTVERQPPKPKPAPPKPRIVERKPKPEEPRRRAERAAAPSAAPQRAAAPNPPSPGVAAQPTVSTASWRGSLIAHLNRYKRFPGGASPGTVQVAFSIDRAGRVLSARLAGSSGDAALDEEAVSMIRRASPLPAPPDGMGGGTVSLSVPIRYTR